MSLSNFPWISGLGFIYYAPMWHSICQWPQCHYQCHYRQWHCDYMTQSLFLMVVKIGNVLFWILLNLSHHHITALIDILLVFSFILKISELGSKLYCLNREQNTVLSIVGDYFQNQNIFPLINWKAIPNTSYRTVERRRVRTICV